MEFKLKIEKVENRGGKRGGAGRKSFENARNNKAGFMLSKKALENLERMATEKNTSKNDIINSLLEELYL